MDLSARLGRRYASARQSLRGLQRPLAFAPLGGALARPPSTTSCSSPTTTLTTKRCACCASTPDRCAQSALAVQTLRSLGAALEATSGSAASPPCAPDRHACAPKRPPALDGIGHRLRRGTRRSHRDYQSCACTGSCSLTTCGNGRLNSSSALNGRVSSCIQEGIQGEVVFA